jgi:galactokinase
MIDPALVDRVSRCFVDQFGDAPAHVIHAPGRVNLIGEHTDYNDGFVLPCGINYGTVLAVGPRRDRRIVAVAADYGAARDDFDLSAPIVNRADADWTDHIRGIASIVIDRGHAIGGANIAIGGNVPQGAGLSSSASLGVAMAQALAALNGLDALNPTDFALIAQKSENDFVGTACGIMDQLASARAEAGNALLIDCRSLATRSVPLPADFAVLIVHSGVRRELAESKYNERRSQCEAVARHFGVTALRDVDLATLEAGQHALDPLVFRRARHVVTENARTLAAADALACGDIDTLGSLMAASHASMRDDFEITVPPVDALAAMLHAHIGGAGGARMTGGGFGGCVVAVLPKDMVARARAAVEHGYQTPDGAIPVMIEALPSAGASILPSALL